MLKNKVLNKEIKKYWTVILDREEFEPNEVATHILLNSVNLFCKRSITHDCKF